MIGAEISASQGPSTGAALRRATDRYIMDGATVGFNASQDIVAEDATDRGTLLQSGIPPERQPDKSVVWGYAAEHAPYVETGTRPHWPPIEPLIGWARRVLGDEDAAWAIQRKIAMEGTEGVEYVARSIDRMRAWFDAKGVSPYIREELPR